MTTPFIDFYFGKCGQYLSSTWSIVHDLPEGSLKGIGICPPLHTFVVDSIGKSIVIEPINGALVVHDNPVHVVTNAPSFDWHLTNLRQYINLSSHGSQPIKLDSLLHDLFWNSDNEAYDGAFSDVLGSMLQVLNSPCEQRNGI